MADLQKKSLLEGTSTVSGTVAIDQTTAGTTNAVAIKDSTGTAISSGNPLLVQQTGVTAIAVPVQIENATGEEVPVSGTVTVTGVATETTLASIKDTAGIKKITDALPTGTNSIGQVTANAGTNLNTSALATSAKQLADNHQVTVSNASIKVEGANTNAVKVDGSSVTQPVSGTFWQATQPVSGTFWQATQPVSGTFWQATQPISGTVTTTPPSDQTVDVNKIKGTATDVNNGAVSNGTQRVTIANDSTGVVGLNAGTNWIGKVQVGNATDTSIVTTSDGSDIANTNKCLVVIALMYKWDSGNTKWIPYT